MTCCFCIGNQTAIRFTKIRQVGVYNRNNIPLDFPKIICPDCKVDVIIGQFWCKPDGDIVLECFCPSCAEKVRYGGALDDILTLCRRTAETDEEKELPMM